MMKNMKNVLFAVLVATGVIGCSNDVDDVNDRCDASMFYEPQHVTYTHVESQCPDGVIDIATGAEPAYQPGQIPDTCEVLHDIVVNDACRYDLVLECSGYALVVETYQKNAQALVGTARIAEAVCGGLWTFTSEK